MERLTILHVLTHAAVYGTERQVLESLRALHETEIDSHLAFIISPDAEASHALHEAVAAYDDVSATVTFLDHQSVFTMPRTIRRLTRLIREYQVDAVHAYLPAAALYGATAARLARVPAIESITMSGAPERRPAGFATNLYWWRRRYIIALESWQVFVAERVRDAWRAEGLCKSERSSVVDLGFDHTRFDCSKYPDDRDNTRRRLELALSDHPVLLTIGRLHPSKNVSCLLDAFALVLRAAPTALLLVAGEGPDRAHIQQRVQDLGIGDRVRLLGERGDIEELLAFADVYVSASIEESRGYATLEAAASGTPVVVARIPANDEIFRDDVNARLTDPNSPADLSAAIVALISAPEHAARLAEQGQRRVVELFGQSRLRTDLLATYRAVVAAG